LPLLTDSEQVVDVPPKLSARARVFSTGQGRRTDTTDAHPVAPGRPQAWSSPSHAWLWSRTHADDPDRHRPGHHQRGGDQPQSSRT